MAPHWDLSKEMSVNILGEGVWRSHVMLVMVFSFSMRHPVVAAMTRLMVLESGLEIVTAIVTEIV
jgi:hypothetical protein